MESGCSPGMMGSFSISTRRKNQEKSETSTNLSSGIQKMETKILQFIDRITELDMLGI
jgi:hypothetical protein